jgi:hypothetical protein
MEAPHPFRRKHEGDASIREDLQDTMHDPAMDEAYHKVQKMNQGVALRFNEGKPQLSLIDLRSLEPMARVMEFGAGKYERNNWMKGRPVTDLLDCLMRHIAAFQRKEDVDPESKQPVIGHILANAMLISQTLQEHPELDNR